jgi:hypothetical protein
MTAEQGKDMPAGQVPTMNTERKYSTTMPAEELAQALAAHFRALEFETQMFRDSEDRSVIQARKHSLWRDALGVAYALTVVITPGKGQLSVGVGGHEWVDTALSGVIGVTLLPPVLLGTAYGIWKKHNLDKDVWRVVDERIEAPTKASP